MTRLEEEIRHAIPDYDEVPDIYLDQYWELVAKAAAEVAKKYIEGAFDAGNFYTAKGGIRSTHDEDKAEWLKEKGITE